MADLATSEPREVILGDTIQWTRPDLADQYPPADWTLTYFFVSRNPAKTFSVVATDSAGVFLVDLGAASGVQASFERIGESGYEWSARVVMGTEKHTVGSGWISIAPDMSTVQGGVDRRSWAVRTLELLKSVIEGRAGADVNMYMLGGKQVMKMTPEELQGWFEWISTLAQSELSIVDPTQQFDRRIHVTLRRGF